jgi:hypothetical protein
VSIHKQHFVERKIRGENQTKKRVYAKETSAKNAVEEIYLQRRPEENHLRQS